MRIELKNKSGFTIIELLVAVIIIGILVTILIPIISNRAKEARINSCMAELKELAEAERRLVIDHERWGRFYILDDLPGTGDGIPNNSITPKDTSDALADEVLAGNYNPNSANYFIAIYENIEDINHENIIINSNNVINESHYGGPYVNYRRNMEVDPLNPSEQMDIPLDPWNSPYLIFTKHGLVDEFDTTQFQLLHDASTLLATNGDGTILGGTETQVFDRFTILSLGPDQMIGDAMDATDNFGEGDDLFIQP